jgi:hypothetical protein
MPRKVTDFVFARAENLAKIPCNPQTYGWQARYNTLNSWTTPRLIAFLYSKLDANRSKMIPRYSIFSDPANLSSVLSERRGQVSPWEKGLA